MLHLKNYSVKIPNGVYLKLKKNILIIQGPLGTTKLTIYNSLFFNEEKNSITVTDILLNGALSKKKKNIQNLTFSLVKFLIYGVRFKFKKQLVIVGVGYKVFKDNDNLFLNLKLGYSHPVKIKIPHNLTVTCPKPTIINISGISKQNVNDFAAKIRNKKLPEPYKGKGIKYFDEIIIKKEGKRS